MKNEILHCIQDDRTGSRSKKALQFLSILFVIPCPTFRHIECSRRISFPPSPTTPFCHPKRSRGPDSSHLRAEHISGAVFTASVRKYFRSPIFIRIGNVYTLTKHSVSGDIIHGIAVIAFAFVHCIHIA